MRGVAYRTLPETTPRLILRVHGRFVPAVHRHVPPKLGTWRLDHQEAWACFCGVFTIALKRLATTVVTQVSPMMVIMVIAI